MRDSSSDGDRSTGRGRDIVIAISKAASVMASKAAALTMMSFNRVAVMVVALETATVMAASS